MIPALIPALVVALGVHVAPAPLSPAVPTRTSQTGDTTAPWISGPGPCTATQPCLTPQYCPDTGRFVVGYQPCPALVNGPYAPGGLQPNED